ncbi:MAG: CTP synthase, partial [Actinomycetota bacterium]|nr:CTP synthase [Actinomycetota bacterium]
IDAGMVFSGTSPDGRLVEIAEITDHPFYIGSQFHPEFKSRPLRPHPLFYGFVGASARKTSEDGEAAAEALRPEERAAAG